MNKSFLGNTPSHTLHAFGIILVFIVLGASNAFVQDDAFISFRYAENLIAGHGLVWNPGEVSPVEGYTNFLWVILIAALMWIGIDPVNASIGLGLLVGAGTLFTLYAATKKLLSSHLLGLFAITITGANATFNHYLTGGLETQLQAFLVTLAFLLTIYICTDTSPEKNRLWAISLSFVAALALMTRLDSALPIAVLNLGIIYSALRTNTNKRSLIQLFLFLSLPATVIIGGWLIWKLNMYGDILPNTFYAKANLDIEGRYTLGFYYVYNFVSSYWLAPVLLIALFLGKKLFANPLFIAAGVIVLLWTLYIVKVGGDFMEFRFFVPIIPLIALLLCQAISHFESPAIRVAFVTALLMGSLNHAYSYSVHNGVESIKDLTNHLYAPDEQWINIGKQLNTLFYDAEHRVSIATTASGAIPFYSKLNTLDMHGLSDRGVLENHVVIGKRPGHQIVTHPDYLNEQQINLVIGHPVIIQSNSPDARKHLDPRTTLQRLYSTSPSKSLPLDASLIELPLDEEHNLLVLYLTKSAFIDSKIEALGLRQYILRPKR